MNFSRISTIGVRGEYVFLIRLQTFLKASRNNPVIYIITYVNPRLYTHESWQVSSFSPVIPTPISCKPRGSNYLLF